MKLNKLRALLLAGAFLIPTTSYAADISVKDTFDDMINTIWTSATGSGQKEMPAKQATAIYLCQPGIPINPATMDDMLDLSNPTGHPAPLQYFSQWFDSIPDISLLRWQPTTGKVSGAFDAVVNGANSNAAPFTEAEKKQCRCEGHGQAPGIPF